jgi:hypothetical protein
MCSSLARALIILLSIIFYVSKCVDSLRAQNKLLFPARISTTTLKSNSADYSFKLPKIAAGAIVASSILLSGGARNAHAQIPTMDEYNTGSGTVIRKQPVVAKAITMKSPEQKVFSIVDTKGRLKIIESFIDAKAWDDVLSEVNQMKLVSKKNFAYTSSSEAAKSLGVSQSSMASLDDVREELSFQLGQLRDLALANRVIFFNKIDLDAVEAMKSEEVVEDAADPVKEASAILSEAKDTLAKMGEIIPAI